MMTIMSLYVGQMKMRDGGKLKKKELLMMKLKN
jgi:hypothetical protein